MGTPLNFLISLCTNVPYSSFTYKFWLSVDSGDRRLRVVIKYFNKKEEDHVETFLAV